MNPRRLPSRIVCLTTETVEVLYALGEQARVAGISGYTVIPPRARGGASAGVLTACVGDRAHHAAASASPHASATSANDFKRAP